MSSHNIATCRTLTTRPLTESIYPSLCMNTDMHPLQKVTLPNPKRNLQNMIRTLKSSLFKPQHQLLFNLRPSPSINHKHASLRFIQATPKSNEEQQDQTMQQQQQQQQQEQDVKKSTEDVMSHSFGQGYKTRSEDEGFGGVYGGNQSEEEEVDVMDVNHVLHPEYDKSQGSEAKEKENARNQMEASS